MQRLDVTIGLHEGVGSLQANTSDSTMASKGVYMVGS